MKLDGTKKFSINDVDFLLFDSNKRELTNINNQKPLSSYFTGEPDTGYWQLKAKQGSKNVQGETAKVKFTVTDQCDLSTFTDADFSNYLNRHDAVLFDWNNTYQNLLDDFYSAIEEWELDSKKNPATIQYIECKNINILSLLTTSQAIREAWLFSRFPGGVGKFVF